MTLWDEMRAWSKYTRDNFSTFLLLCVFVGFLGMILHESHDKDDAAIQDWTRTQATGIIGALLYALTGREKDKRLNQTDDPDHPPPPVRTLDVHVEDPVKQPEDAKPKKEK